MNVLIVHAHPEARSFTTAMKDLAVETLTAAGHTVVVSDLYAMNFDPIAKAGDFTDRKNPDYLVYALEQRHGYQGRSLAPDIMAEVEKLRTADLLILNFPIFWFSLPAIMKGWIDRVFVSGLTYGGLRFYDKGGLAGKTALMAFTLGGQPHMFGPDAVHGALPDMLRHVIRGSLQYVGFRVLPPFIGFHVPYISHDQRVACLADYKRHLESLDRLTPLDGTSLDDFDEALFPKGTVPAA